MSLTGKHIAILGAGRSGRAAAALALREGASVSVWDTAGPEAFVGMPGGVEIHPNTSEEGCGDQVSDLLVVSPGIDSCGSYVAAFSAQAGEIIGEVELAARYYRGRIVGITGTNGKSTTTALIHHILQTAGVPSLMGGNIGLPILSRDPLPEGGVYVLELSSYQIDLTKSLDCDVAVLLNITPDHLDRYDSFKDYAASKYRLFAMQKEGAAVALGQTLFEFGAIEAGSGSVSLIEDVLDSKFPQLLDRRQFPTLQGPHNHDNMLAAIKVCDFLGLNVEQIREGLATYPGLPHRMERVGERHGVVFVNDSKATNTDAATPALSAFERVRWIVGGRAKDNSLGGTARQLDHVVAAYTIGEAGPMFARLLREAGVSVIECETLENAVKCAAEDSQAGETVLLSPASASFDQFKDFEARGDRFRELVGAL